MKRVAIIAVATLLMANAAAPNIERKERMDHVQDAIDAIFEAIDAKDPAAVGAQVKVIDAAFVIEQDQWRSAGKPDRAQMAADSARRGAAVAAAATTGDWPGATTALAALNQPCRACHDLELPRK